MNRIAFIAVALVAGATLALVAGGCGAPQPRARTVAELTADPLVLQGLVARCAADKHAAARDAECANARLAIDLIGAQHDREQLSQRGPEFDRQRELRRRRDEQAQRAVANPEFDPYSSPVAPDRPQPSGEDR